MKYLNLIITITLICLTSYLCITQNSTSYLTPIFISTWIAHLHFLRSDKRKDTTVSVPINTTYLTDITNLMTKVNELNTTVELTKIKR